MRKFISFIAWSLAAIAASGTLALAASYLYLNPQVPDTDTFRSVDLKAPLRIYSADGKLIQEFGERLIPVTYDEIPPLFEAALLDTEDKRFYEHAGIDLITVANATWQLVRNQGAIRTGASTITMQLVKNVSGKSEVRFIRKFREMLLALKIEREMSKQEILTLYLNIISFGKHAYGLQAAANTYYGKDVGELSLAEMAMLAGIPKAPEAGNPINGPQRALNRRNLVLQRMLVQGSITREQYETATAAPITASVHGRQTELPALYAAEMVRKHLLTEYGRSAYQQGLEVYTTLDSRMQAAADDALTNKLLEYDRRHGYRGPVERRVTGTADYVAAPEHGIPDAWYKRLQDTETLGFQEPAIVTAIDEDSISVLMRNGTAVIARDGYTWARAYQDVNRRGPVPAGPGDLVAIGDLIRVENLSGQWQLGQTPRIQGAIVALDPKDGAIRAMAGGFDFRANQFNHATQARRQPGSNFKPFFYAGAMEEGLTAATIYNDAPIVLPGGELEETYRPKNSGERFRGNIRLREALYRSINLVSLRIILDFGPDNAIRYVSRFGFDTENFPRNVQLAFGGGTIALSPLDVATGYAAFANGGRKVDPYLIARIESINHDEVFVADPAVVCESPCEPGVRAAEQIIEPRVAYVMNSILGDTIKRGTARKAHRALQREDLMGKTGTTNNADIWFSGYTPDLVATAWAGFADNSPVGDNEWGSTTPLETWVDFMAAALPPESESTPLARPDGLVAIRINPETGERAEANDSTAIFEVFREEFAPEEGIAHKDDKVVDPYQQIF